jgi:hypothetical protein
MVLVSDFDIRVYSLSRIFWTTVIRSWIMRSCVMEPGVRCNIPSDHTYYLVRELYTSEWETGLEAGVRSDFPHRLHTYGTHHTQTSELYRFCTLIRRGYTEGEGNQEGSGTYPMWWLALGMCLGRRSLHGGSNHFTALQCSHRLAVAVCLHFSELRTEFLEAVNRKISLVGCDTV